MFQFSIKHLLAWIAAIAVAVTVGAPLYSIYANRDSQISANLMMAATCGMFLAPGVFGVLGFVVTRRGSEEAKAMGVVVGIGVGVAVSVLCYLLGSQMAREIVSL